MQYVIETLKKLKDKLEYKAYDYVKATGNPRGKVYIELREHCQEIELAIEILNKNINKQKGEKNENK